MSSLLRSVALQRSEDAARRQCHDAEDAALQQQAQVERASFRRRMRQVQWCSGLSHGHVLERLYNETATLDGLSRCFAMFSRLRSTLRTYQRSLRYRKCCVFIGVAALEQSNFQLKSQPKQVRLLQPKIYVKEIKGIAVTNGAHTSDFRTFVDVQLLILSKTSRKEMLPGS